METIAAFFLRAKHWQIFLLIVCSQLIGLLIVAFSRTNASSELGFGLVNLVGSIIWTIGMVSLMGWYWSMGMFLNSLGRPRLRLNTGFFRFAVVYHVLYILVFTTFKFSSGGGNLPSFLLPFSIFAPICLLYVLYFGSRSLAMAESGKPVTFLDYVGPMFLVWLFPIGIWFVQPRINRLHPQGKNQGVPTHHH